jgi:hypothetical protein
MSKRKSDQYEDNDENQENEENEQTDAKKVKHIDSSPQSQLVLSSKPANALNEINTNIQSQNFTIVQLDNNNNSQILKLIDGLNNDIDDEEEDADFINYVNQSMTQAEVKIEAGVEEQAEEKEVIVEQAKLKEETVVVVKAEVREDLVVVEQPKVQFDAQKNDQNPIRNIKKLLQTVKPTNKWTVNGEALELPSVPGLAINNFSDLPLPISEHQAQILNQFKNATSNVIEFSAKDFELKNELWNKNLSLLFQKVISELGCVNKVKFHLLKLQICSAGYRVNKKIPPKKETKGFATVMIQLPSKYTGGCLNVFSDNIGQSFYFGQTENRAPYSIHYAAFYNSLEYEIAEITSGYRVMLVYELVGDESYVSINELNNKMVAQLSALDEIKPAKQDEHTFPVAVFLENTYDDNEFERNGISALKGKDSTRFKLLKDANESLPQSKKLKFFILKAQYEIEFDKDYDAIMDNGANYSLYGDLYGNIYTNEAEYDSESSEFYEESERRLDIEKLYDSNGRAYFRGHEDDFSFDSINNVICPYKDINNIDCPFDESCWGEAEEDFLDNGKVNNYEKYFLLFWPSLNELKMFFKLDYGLCASLVLDPRPSNDEVFVNNFKTFIDLLKEARINKELSSRFECTVEKILKVLTHLKDLVLTKTFIGEIMESYNKAHCDDLASLIKLFGWESLLGCLQRFILPIENKNFKSNCSLVQV